MSETAAEVYWRFTIKWQRRGKQEGKERADKTKRTY